MMQKRRLFWQQPTIDDVAPRCFHLLVITNTEPQGILKIVQIFCKLFQITKALRNLTWIILCLQGCDTMKKKLVNFFSWTYFLHLQDRRLHVVTSQNMVQTLPGFRNSYIPDGLGPQNDRPARLCHRPAILIFFSYLLLNALFVSAS